MALEPKTYYLIEKMHLESLDSTAVLDMLRYDYATVESNAPPEFIMLSNDDGPGKERWEYFGISIVFIGKTSGECWDFVRGLKK